jgi:methyl-accepting chemotaxis protein
MSMGERTGGGKLHDIKETASDAVEIIRELGTPGVQETFTKIREISITAREIMETMKTPEWQQNLENFRLISDNFNQASGRLDKVVAEIRETGVLDETKQLISTARDKIDSFGGSGGDGGVTSSDLKEVVSSIREMMKSVSNLVDELRLLASDSRRTGTLRTIRDTIGEAHEAANTLRDAQESRSSG